MITEDMENVYSNYLYYYKGIIIIIKCKIILFTVFI